MPPPIIIDPIDNLGSLLEDLESIPLESFKNKNNKGGLSVSTKEDQYSKGNEKLNGKLGGTVSKPADKYLKAPEIEVFNGSTSPLPFLEGRSPLLRPDSATSEHSQNEEVDSNFQSYHLDYKYTPPPIKGPCNVCGDGIIGPMVTALDKMWHPEHFCCVNCGVELRSPMYTEKDGKPYCKGCYNKLFLPPCFACNKEITGKYVTALGGVWHPECFCCAWCHAPLPSNNFFEKGGKPYCEKDYHDLFSPKCFSCNYPITDGRKVSVMGRNWHPECFVCCVCGCQLNPNNFKEKDGKLYCLNDFNDRFMPKCAACSKPILQEPTVAMGKKWHPQCFQCTECKKQLSPNNYFEKDGKPYCENDFHKLFSPKCAGCQKPIKDPKSMVTAMGKPWHPEHFKCTECGKILKPPKFLEKNGLPYCEDDYHKLFSPKCAGCNGPIKDQQRVVEAMGKKWHPEHFNCKDCHKVLSPKDFLQKDGVPYCDDCYHKRFSPKCAGCSQPIKDQNNVVKALGKTWHPEHFNCTACKKILSPSKFWEKNGLPYCEDDYHKLFSPKCVACGQPIKETPMIVGGKYYHPEHFKCNDCGKKLENNEFYEREGIYYCIKDYLNRFAPKCKGCGQPVTGYCLSALNADWHPGCFKCKDCGRLLEYINFYEIDGEPFCESHFHARQCADCTRLRRVQDKYFGTCISYSSQGDIRQVDLLHEKETISKSATSNPQNPHTHTVTFADQLSNQPPPSKNQGREISHFIHREGAPRQGYPSVFEDGSNKKVNSSAKFPTEDAQNLQFEQNMRKEQYCSKKSCN